MNINEMLNQIKKDMNGKPEIEDKEPTENTEDPKPIEIIKELLAREDIDLDQIDSDSIEIKKLEGVEKEMLERAIFSPEGFDTGCMPPLPVFAMTVSALVGAETLTNILIDKDIIQEEEIKEAGEKVQMDVQKILLQSFGLKI